jgi:uncharacterized phage protein (TIGR02216 family)
MTKPDPKGDPKPKPDPKPQPEPDPAPAPPASLDWPALMRAGLSPLQLGGLALRPPEFWALTPAELAMMLGQTAVPGMGRARFEALAAMYPDDPRP